MNQRVELEVLAKGVEAAVRVRDHPEHQPAAGSSSQHRRDIVVHLEVMIGRPLRRRCARAARDDAGAAAAHVLDDRGGVVNEESRIVDLLLDLVEDERRRRDGRVEARRIDVDASWRAERAA